MKEEITKTQELDSLIVGQQLTHHSNNPLDEEKEQKWHDNASQNTNQMLSSTQHITTSLSQRSSKSKSPRKKLASTQRHSASRSASTAQRKSTSRGQSVRKR